MKKNIFYYFPYFKRALKPAKFFTGIVLLIGSISITSCNEPSTIGLDVQPQEDLINASTNDTFILSTFTQRDDSLMTDEVPSGVALLGSYNDPVFGKAAASLYEQISMPSYLNNITFGEKKNLVLDSIVLSLRYYAYYGTLNPQTVKVYKLSQTINKDSTYYSNSTLAYDPVEIGSKTFTPIHPDCTMVLKEPKMGTQKVKAHIRIKLSASIGRELLSKSGSSELVDNTSFHTFFKGLYITTSNGSQPPDQGAIFNINLFDDNTRMTLYYRDSVKADTTMFAFEVLSSSARFNHFSHDYTSAPAITAQLADPALGKNLVYLQTMAGLRAKIHFPALQNWINVTKPVVVNKAELVIKADPSTITKKYAPPSQLYLFPSDEKGKKIGLENLPDWFEGELYYGGKYDTTRKEYRFNLARYVQAMATNKKTDYGFYLVTGNSAVSANRVVIGGGANNAYRMKLQLTYTKLN